MRGVEAAGSATGEAVCDAFDTTRRRVIGTWWSLYKPEWGERAGMFLDPNWRGPAYQTCVNLGRVCGAFEINRRRLSLSFNHHAEAAGIADESEADALLDWCEEPIRLGSKPIRTGPAGAAIARGG